LVKAKKDLAADDNFPHLATTKAGAAHIEDRPPLIYHFDTEATKGYKIHAHSAFANYQASSCLNGGRWWSATRSPTSPSRPSASAASAHSARSDFS
jgi:hypothetical protein